VKLVLSLVQMNCRDGMVEANLAHATEAVREAAGRGSDIVLLPELWASGYDLEYAAQHAAPLGEGAFARSAELASRFRVWLAGSLLERGQDGSYYNTAAIWDSSGALRGVYRKIHLFRPMSEDKYLAAGDRMSLVESPWGSLAIAICYDLRFPEMFRQYAVAGAGLTLVPAQWPRVRVSHWQILLRARAIEDQMFIAGCNRVGAQGEALFGGRSAVIGPWGEVLTEGGEEEEVLTAEVDLDQVERARRKLPILLDRRPELYGPLA